MILLCANAPQEYSTRMIPMHGVQGVTTDKTGILEKIVDISSKILLSIISNPSCSPAHDYEPI